MKKSILLLLFLFFLKTISACECPQLQPISIDMCDKYSVIFLGKVDSVFKSNEKNFDIAYFTIEKLYKGNVQQQIKINFDGFSSCMMSFSKDDEWLIYAEYKKFDYLTVSICGHCRKYFNDASADFYQIAAKRTFNEEKQFLETTFDIKPFAKVNALYEQEEQYRPHNTQPEPMNKLWLLLVSVISMGIVFFVTRKKK